MLGKVRALWAVVGVAGLILFCGADHAATRSAEPELDSLASKTGTALNRTPNPDRARSLHWAFQPLQNPAPPRVTNSGWPLSGIDRFVLSKIEADGLRPAPPADKRTLLRRATFDLIGLSPTPPEVDSFISDTSSDAFARVVDRLLNSPHYGERWGRHWMDIVRYADTAGETADYPIPVAWRYRNYVIDSFNADKPYNTFLREQIAGDVMARRGASEHYAQDVTATGYLALSRRFGFDSENYHHLTIQDTIDTLGQTVLGLSLGCARCHDHKYDPVSMNDYYALYGIFESTRYAFPGSEQKQKFRALVPLLPPSESHEKWRAFDVKVGGLSQMLEKQKQPVPGAVLRSLDEIDGDFEMQAPAAGGSKGVLVPPWVCDGMISVTKEAQSPFKNLNTRGQVGVHVPSNTNSYFIGQALPSRHARDHGSLLFVNLDFRVATNDVSALGAHRFWLGKQHGLPAIEVRVSSTSVALRTGDTTAPVLLLKPNQWHNLQLTLDLQTRTFSGSGGTAEGVVSFANKPFSISSPGVIDFVAMDSIASDQKLLPGIEIDNLGIQNVPINAVSTTPPTLASSAKKIDAKAITDPPQASHENLKQDLNSLLAEGPFDLAYAVVEGTPRNARLQVRGEPDRPGVEVPRGFITALGGKPLPAGTEGSGRLELAEWLTGPDNPLTARVMVNRLWQFHFGRGLVKTPNDFGLRGQAPTHPEMLDYLAVRFVQSGWSMKAMHRLIMLSSTYQQANADGSSAATVPPRFAAGSAGPVIASGPEQNSIRQAGPEGRGLLSEWDRADLYAAFPRRRISAEEIRDAILQVSGELDVAPGHGHPFPTPIGWGYTQHGPFSAVYEHNKRSVYLMTQRIKRHPFLALFDGADPNASTAERRATTVPTQALFFLNDPFIHAQAGKFSERLRRLYHDEPGRIAAAYRLALGRFPSESEQAEAAEFLAAYRAEPTAARNGDADGAALAAYGRAIFGSSEFLHID